MLKFILRRLLEAIPTLFILITISFFMMRRTRQSIYRGTRIAAGSYGEHRSQISFERPDLETVRSLSGAACAGRLRPVLKYKDYSVNDLVASSFPVSAKLGPPRFCWRWCWGERRRYRRAESEHQMGLHGDGVRHDRGGDTQFRGGAAAGADLRHHAEMAAGAGTAARLNSSSCRWWRCRWPISPASPVSRVAR